MPLSQYFRAVVGQRAVLVDGGRRHGEFAVSCEWVAGVSVRRCLVWPSHGNERGGNPGALHNAWRGSPAATSVLFGRPAIGSTGRYIDLRAELSILWWECFSRGLDHNCNLLVTLVTTQQPVRRTPDCVANYCSGNVLSMQHRSEQPLHFKRDIATCCKSPVFLPWLKSTF